jgi:nicotinamide-nucleotide amidase
MFSDKLVELAKNVISACKKYNLRLATAESCTGGLIAGCLTSISGASDVLKFGFVTYTNQAKINMLGVSASILNEHGAVSEIVSRSMANGAIKPGNADISVSVTGIAGPDGGSNKKPVGLVHISVARNHFDTLHERHLFNGDREAIRLQTVTAALKLLLKQIETQP